MNKIVRSLCEFVLRPGFSLGYYAGTCDAKRQILNELELKYINYKNAWITPEKAQTDVHKPHIIERGINWDYVIGKEEGIEECIALINGEQKGNTWPVITVEENKEVKR